MKVLKITQPDILKIGWYWLFTILFPDELFTLFVTVLLRYSTFRALMMKSFFFYINGEDHFFPTL
jgi:hypothetical protein